MYSLKYLDKTKYAVVGDLPDMYVLKTFLVVFLFIEPYPTQKTCVRLSRSYSSHPAT